MITNHQASPENKVKIIDVKIKVVGGRPNGTDHGLHQMIVNVMLPQKQVVVFPIGFAFEKKINFGLKLKVKVQRDLVLWLQRDVYQRCLVVCK